MSLWIVLSITGDAAAKVDAGVAPVIGKVAPVAEEIAPAAARAAPEVAEGMSGCFAAETLVLTTNGYKPISEVIAGDEVWSFDSERERWGWHEVTRTLVHKH